MSQPEINDVAVNQALDKINKLNNQEEMNESLFESVCSDQTVVSNHFRTFVNYFVKAMAPCLGFR